MHEQSLIRALVRQLEEVASAERASRITSIRVWCGALSHFTPEHFREHFDREAAGTVAEGAAVEVDVSADVTHFDAAGLRLLSVDVEP